MVYWRCTWPVGLFYQNKEPLACFKEVSIGLEDFVEKIRGYVGETELQIGNVCENGDSFCTSCGF